MAARATAANAIALRGSNIAPSDSTGLNQALSGLSEILIAAATQKVDAEINRGDYTELERRSLIVVEALHLTSGMDLSAIITRGALIQQIEQEGLVSVHPGQYVTLEAMAAEQGISTGELSDTRAMCQIIFPYIENTLGLSVAGIWSSIGKSVFREMIPALRSLMTGEQHSHTSVRASVEKMLDDAAASMIVEHEIADDITSMGDDELAERTSLIRNRAIRDLLALGSTAPVRQMRATLRPTRTQPLAGVVIAPFRGTEVDGAGYILMKFHGQDQLDMYRLLMRDHVVTTTLNSHLDVDDAPRGPRAYMESFNSLFGENE